MMPTVDKLAGDFAGPSKGFKGRSGWKSGSIATVWYRRNPELFGFPKWENDPKNIGIPRRSAIKRTF
jgi:hypothetical protein